VKILAVVNDVKLSRVICSRRSIIIPILCYRLPHCPNLVKHNVMDMSAAEQNVQLYMSMVSETIAQHAVATEKMIFVTFSMWYMI
jgi:hypothetical protein